MYNGRKTIKSQDEITEVWDESRVRGLNFCKIKDN